MTIRIDHKDNVGLPIKADVTCPRCGEVTTVSTTIRTWGWSVIFQCACGQELGAKFDLLTTLTTYEAVNVNQPRPPGS